VSDRYKGLTVAFDRELTEEEARCVAGALRLMTWVADVQLSLTEPNDFMNRARVRTEIGEKLFEAVYGKSGK
jgi:hypothetical protein